MQRLPVSDSETVSPVRNAGFARPIPFPRLPVAKTCPSLYASALLQDKAKSHYAGRDFLSHKQHSKHSHLHVLEACVQEIGAGRSFGPADLHHLCEHLVRHLDGVVGIVVALGAGVLGVRA